MVPSTALSHNLRQHTRSNFARLQSFSCGNVAESVQHHPSYDVVN
jgi:hypothetical protein